MNFDSFIPKYYIEREVEKEIFKFLSDREIIIIRGPRQTGKSTLLKKIALFLQKKSQDDNVFYIDLEDEMELTKFETNPKEYLEFFLRGHKQAFFLIDEIQYVKKGGKILKFLYDHYPQIKFIVTGSSTLDGAKLGEYLVGRAVFFELYPFSFGEFLRAKNKLVYWEYQEKKFSLDKQKKAHSLRLEPLSCYLREYLTFGGYPRIVLESDREKKIVLLKNLFSTYIEKDVIKLYGIKYKEKALILLRYLASTIGNLLNYNELCQITKAHFQEVKELMAIFEETYIIKRVSPFHKNLVTELKKNPKIYFFDLGLRNVLLERFDFAEEEWGRIMENYGFLLFKHYPLSFWRTTAKAEVDFVLKDKLIPVEIKMTPKISRSLMSFIDCYHPKTAIIINENQSDVVEKKKTKIFFIPATLI